MLRKPFEFVYLCRLCVCRTDICIFETRLRNRLFFFLFISRLSGRFLIFRWIQLHKFSSRFLSQKNDLKPIPTSAYAEQRAQSSGMKKKTDQHAYSAKSLSLYCYRRNFCSAHWNRQWFVSMNIFRKLCSLVRNGMGWEASGDMCNVIVMSMNGNAPRHWALLLHTQVHGTGIFVVWFETALKHKPKRWWYKRWWSNKCTRRYDEKGTNADESE